MHYGRVSSTTCELKLQVNGFCVLCLFNLQPQKLRWVINIYLLYVIARYTWLGLFAIIVLWSRTNTSFYYFSIFIITKIYLSHKFWINLCVIFCNTIFAVDKYKYSLLKALITKKHNHWSMGLYQGLEDCCEGDCDSNLTVWRQWFPGNTLL